MKKNFLKILIFAFSLFAFSCKEQITITKNGTVLDIFKTVVENLTEERGKLTDAAINSYFESLSVEDRVGQLLLVSIDGKSEKDVERIRKANKITPGGYLIFNINVPETEEEMISFLSALRNKIIEDGKIPCYFSIDHEGGVVNRLRNICSYMPSQKAVAEHFTVSEAEEFYYYQGIQLSALGIDINLAPVVEVLTEDNKDFLGTRSFGNYEKTEIYSEAAISGLMRAGILPVMKHFPGNTNNDPHTGLPVISCSEEDFKKNYLEIFSKLSQKKGAAVLVAHTTVPSVDDKPACLSEKLVENYLVKDYGFEGLIFSDDLLMSALMKNGYPEKESLLMALNAGVHCLMICKASFDVYADILIDEYRENEEIREKINQSVKKILKWKPDNGLLEKSFYSDGYFSYSCNIGLPEMETSEDIDYKKILFDDAYLKAKNLYDTAWWK